MRYHVWRCRSSPHISTTKEVAYMSLPKILGIFCLVLPTDHSLRKETGVVIQVLLAQCNRSPTVCVQRHSMISVVTTVSRQNGTRLHLCLFQCLTDVTTLQPYCEIRLGVARPSKLGIVCKLEPNDFTSPQCLPKLLHAHHHPRIDPQSIHTVS